MMNFKLTLPILLVVLALGSSAFATHRVDKKEAEMLMKASTFLEQSPLDDKAKDLRLWAFSYLAETDDVTVTLCSLFLSIDKNYKYQGVIYMQYSIAMGAFKLANPDKAQDEPAIQLAGIESAIKTYEAIIKEKPKAKDAFMDQLLAKRADSSLTQYVAENNCKKKS